MTGTTTDTTDPTGLIPEQRDRFRIEGQKQLSWAMRKLAGTKAELDGHRAAVAAEKAPYEAKLARIEEWAEVEERDLAGSVRYFEGLIEEYALACRRVDPKATSLSTPWGKVSTRQDPATVVWENDAAAIEFLSEHAPDLVKTEERRTLRKAELKKAADVVDGELVVKAGPLAGSPVPGVKVLPPGDPKVTVVVESDPDLLVDDEEEQA